MLLMMMSMMPPPPLTVPTSRVRNCNAGGVRMPCWSVNGTLAKTLTSADGAGCGGFPGFEGAAIYVRPVRASW